MGDYLGINSLLGRDSVGNGLRRFDPEPRNTVGNTFQRVLNAAGSVLNPAAKTLAGISPEYQALLERQMEVQQQMQLVSLHSNIEKSKHETQMAAVRNIRAG